MLCIWYVWWLPYKTFSVSDSLFLPPFSTNTQTDIQTDKRTDRPSLLTAFDCVLLLCSTHKQQWLPMLVAQCGEFRESPLSSSQSYSIIVIIVLFYLCITTITTYYKRILKFSFIQLYTYPIRSTKYIYIDIHTYIHT